MLQLLLEGVQGPSVLLHKLQGPSVLLHNLQGSSVLHKLQEMDPQTPISNPQRGGPALEREPGGDSWNGEAGDPPS